MIFYGIIKKTFILHNIIKRSKVSKVWQIKVNPPIEPRYEFLLFATVVNNDKSGTVKSHFTVPLYGTTDITPWGNK